MKTLTLSSKIIIDKNNKINFQIDEDLSNFINFLKVKTLPIELKNNKLKLNSLKNSDGLILSGGGDIYSKKKTKLNLIRDNYEKKLFNYFYKKNKPILAICRGFQLIADLNKIKLFKIGGHVRTTHSLIVRKNTFISQKHLTVNSYHNYILKDLPNNYLNISGTNDGSIEIAIHKYKKILCLMFHPERKMKSKKIILKSIKKFFK
jgi:gamma-glutamyl-gamma-aminobutyrate hydrolase PuuD